MSDGRPKPAGTMFNSIRWSLQLWHAAVLAIVLTVFGIIVSHLQAEAAMQQIDAELYRTADIVAGSLRPVRFRREGGPPPRPGSERTPSAEKARTDESSDRGRVVSSSDPPKNEPNRRNDGEWRRTDRRGETKLELSGDLLELFDGDEASFYFVVWREGSPPLLRSSHAPEILLPELKREPGDAPIRFVRQRGEFREAIHGSRFGWNVLVGRSLTQDWAALQRSRGILLVSGIGVLAAGLLGGWWFSARAIKPIEAISSTAAQISVSNLSQRIDVTDTESELSSLAQTLNRMFDRLEAAFIQQVRFTADASHELRTPLAVILTHSELALGKPRSNEELRDTLQVCRRSALRMKSLVESLLTLARIDSGELSLDYREMDLSQVVGECMGMVRALAEERKLRLQGDLEPTPMLGDAERIAQVVTNVLTNAIRYNREGGQIDVTVHGTETEAIVSVTDTGAGIPAEHLPHVFARFFRGDPSRTAKESTGLGLAICQSIVEAHGGVIGIPRSDASGTTFEIRLPRRQSIARERRELALANP